MDSLVSGSACWPGVSPHRTAEAQGMSISNIMAVSSSLCLEKSTRLLIPVKFQCAC